MPAASQDRNAVLVQRALELLTPKRGERNIQIPVLPIPREALLGMRHEDRRYTQVDWPALLSRARALPRSVDPESQAVVTWQEMRVSLSETGFHMSISRNEDPRASSTAWFFDEPQAKEVARQLLLNIIPPAGLPPGRYLALPRSMLFAARVGGSIMRACLPLLELLDITPMLEPWWAAAESALMHDTNPWGYNYVRRCIRCKRSAEGALPAQAPQRGSTKLKLRYCANCKLAEYCSSECQHADWASHKEMCKFSVEWKKEHS